MSEWISIDDKMPEAHIAILFWSDNDSAMRIGAFYRNSGKFISNGDKYDHCDITHWMPLPEAPK